MGIENKKGGEGRGGGGGKSTGRVPRPGAPRAGKHKRPETAGPRQGTAGKGIKKAGATGSTGNLSLEGTEQRTMTKRPKEG